MNNMITLQLKQLLKNKVMIMTFLIYPSLLTFIIGYLAESTFMAGISSYDYYSSSMMIFIFMGAGLIALYNLGEKNVVDGHFRVMYSPISSSYIYISQIISSTIFSALSIVINILIFKFLFKINYSGNEFIIGLGFITLAFLSNALAMFLYSFIKDIGICNGIFNLIQVILCTLGGAFISLEGFGKIASFLSKLSPIKYLIDGILQSIYDDNRVMLFTIIIINFLIALIIIAITKRTFKVEKYL